MNKILELLKEGDLRTTGKVKEVVLMINNNVKLFDDLFEGLRSEDPGVRMRSADAMEKVTKNNPELLIPYKNELIKIAKETIQQEVQWHMALMFSYINLNESEKNKATEILFQYYESSKSNIVKVFSLTTLAQIAKEYSRIQSQVKALVVEGSKSTTPSIRSRCKRLIKVVEKY